MMQAADTACFAAKQAGRNQIHVYHPEDVEITRRQGEMRWVSRILMALQEDRFTLYQQRISPVADGPGRHYFEILLRMLDTDDRTIAPGSFLPAAERHRLIERLDRWVIANTLEWLARPARGAGRPLPVRHQPVGPQPGQRAHPALLEDQITRYDIPPEKRRFEVTETVAAEDPDKATRFIAACATGCDFALDDFGTGVSSFGYLRTLPVDFVKIDGIFVKGILDDPPTTCWWRRSTRSPTRWARRPSPSTSRASRSCAAWRRSASTSSRATASAGRSRSARWAARAPGAEAQTGGRNPPAEPRKPSDWYSVGKKRQKQTSILGSSSMAASSTFSRLTTTVNDAFLAPLIALPNLGLAAINATVGGSARLAESAARAASDAGLGAFAEAVEDVSRRVADRALFGFYYMTTQGPLEAVAQDVRGITGGGLALALGDFDWLAKALPRYRRSMDYVYDKAQHDEVQPASDFPLSAALAESATSTVESFPEDLIEALGSGDALEVLRAMFEQPREIATLLVNYPNVEFRVVYDVLVFTLEAYLEAADAYRYSLCELAIMESALSDETRTLLSSSCATAPNPIVQLRVLRAAAGALGGAAEDRAFRRTAGGEIIDLGAIAESVFEPRAIERAQAICSELLSYRPFLWLYGDEKLALRKNRSETTRKFGPEAAQRIEKEPLYPLTDEEVAALTKGGPRPAAEVHRILVEQFRKRGLGELAERVADGLTGKSRRRRQGRPRAGAAARAGRKPAVSRT